MPTWICRACGTQHPDTEAPPAACPICDDPRQPVPPSGQAWTTPEELARTHDATIRVLERDREGEPLLVGIGSTPGFAIGQRALLVRGPSGNVLWDCVPLLDPTIRLAVESLGGIHVIAISHPHYYSTMVDWAHAFGARILLHEADREWVMRPDPVVEHWSGEELALPQGPLLIRGGGHFAGGTVLHWPQGTDGRGALLSGDIVTVLPDQRLVSFMYSYPMLLPLPESEVRRLLAAIEPLPFDRIYGAWWERVIPSGAKAAVSESGRRYLEALAGHLPIHG
ncbi:MAG: MBL fold metallo-hydrolase [Candidatus Dormibacteraeota bacterium]|nr:MBL fold metallo-hydrolase [Candidatus Dormibacteraeota bacterium]